MVIQRVSDIRSIRQEHVSKGALVLVVAMRLDRNFFSEGEVSGGALAVSLALPRAVDAAETDALRVVVRIFKGVAVQDPTPSTWEAVTATEQALIRPLFGR